MAVDDRIVLNSLSSVRRIEDEFVRNLESAMRTIERQITPALQRYNNIGFMDMAVAKQDIENALISAGYFQTISDLLNDGYQSIIDEVESVYFQASGESFNFAEKSLERLNSIKDLDLNEFGQLSNDFAANILRLLSGVSFGDIDLDSAIEFIQNDIDKLTNNAKTWITTGINSVYATAGILLAIDNGINKFKYVGPLDGKTRAFCREHIGEIRTIEGWNELDNGQLYPTSSYRGGYNCRHSLVGVL